MPPTWGRLSLRENAALFIEGNHRTGALLMSYILLRDGEPPFVISAGNADTYFDASAELRAVDKHGPAALLRLPPIRQRLVALLADADPRYLSR